MSGAYDALVDLAPSHEHRPTHAYGLVKQTFRIGDAELEPTRAEPLAHDIRDAEHTKELPLGSDYWTFKRLADVVVLGSAHASGGQPVSQMEVRCDVGASTKRVMVFGRRFIEWRGARARMSAPERFERMPLERALAYGGVDTRVPCPPIESIVDALSLAADHPGAYPRNPDGKGYYVLPDRFDGIEQPNLEDPDDLLSDERLVVGAPEHWWRQPMPWTLDWQPTYGFVRQLFLGIQPRHPAPAGALREVERGILPPNLEDLLSLSADEPSEVLVAEREALAARFYQEASVGMQFADLQEGAPMAVHGMHPERTSMRFVLPPAPRMEIEVDGVSEPVQARITNVVIRPDEEQVLITYCGRTSGLPRVLLPGIHAHIALSLRVDGGDPVRYETPRTTP